MRFGCSKELFHCADPDQTASVVPVCYFDKYFVNSILDYQHLHVVVSRLRKVSKILMHFRVRIGLKST